MNMQNKENNTLRINLTGVSGVGKTTLAKWISEEFKLPFISGSYSDLVPSTKGEKHETMISKDPREIFIQDVQVLNLRNKLFRKNDRYVSDRSYLDSAAYLIQKLSHHIRECDTESFMEMCQALTLIQVTHLIYIPFDKSMIKSWEMEDNHKRVMNRYYQWEVSLIIDGIIDMWGFDFGGVIKSGWDESETNPYGKLHLTHEGKDLTTNILFLNSQTLSQRQKIVSDWLYYTGV